MHAEPDTDRAQQLLDGASGVDTPGGDPPGGGPPGDASPADDFLARRDRAMLELFYSSGLRLCELSGLDLAQLDLASGLVRVHGKGNRVRTLPVGRKAREALQAWLEIRHAAAGDQPLFISQCGQRLSPRAIQLRVRQAGLRELHMPKSPQELPSHTDTLQFHTPLDFQHLARIYDQAHPRAHRRTEAAPEDDVDAKDDTED